MSDVIRLLPDSVANQIAAGEVIQRPASAVKELLENAVDSGASAIRLSVKESGKSLIQVTDNGSGMSETDARMSFERHATSKIKEANDLFAIRTLGFRGEALASIAAIAQVELKSRKADSELGTRLEIEGSQVKSQSPCSCPVGTTVSVKNLFFNVPARRYFLKTDTVELRHIIEEFQRVALVNPEIEFSFHQNDKLVFQLERSTLRQRISAIFGAHLNEKLVPVELLTDLVNISGFVAKPEFVRKTRGEQYFFANNRFIRHPYLHHSIESAYQELIPDGSFPVYFLYIDVDPQTIDINIHPTKTEVNFQNGQVIYASLRSAIRQTLGKSNLSSSIDFENESSIEVNFLANRPIKPPSIKIDPDFNPFKRDFKPIQSENPRPGNIPENWEKLFPQPGTRTLLQPSRQFEETNPEPRHLVEANFEKAAASDPSRSIIQIQNKFIVSSVKSGLVIIDQQRAHERILFEKFMDRLDKTHVGAQQSLFPQTVHLSAVDAVIIKDLQEEITHLGFDLTEFGQNSYVVNGVPSDFPDEDAGKLLEKVIENFKTNRSVLNIDKKVNLARAMAHNLALRSGKALQPEEMQILVGQLFACRIPDSAPDGSPAIRIISVDDLDRRFKS
jgi:DNA mismatch repair protein MutL